MAFVYWLPFLFVLLVRLYAAVTLNVASRRDTLFFFRALSLLFSLPSYLDQSPQEVQRQVIFQEAFVDHRATPAPFLGPFPST